MSQSLRRIVKDATNQDVYKCQACQDCELMNSAGLDIPLGSLVQMVMYDDEEALTCRTLWSDAVLAAARHACKRGLNLQSVILALRNEALKRGVDAEQLQV
jgi:heterodisulfide reductase subunit C